MARSRQFAADWSAGAVDPQFFRRGDVEQLAVGARTLKNVVLKSGGGFKRRPGSQAKAALTDVGRKHVLYRSGTTTEDLLFSDGVMAVYGADGTLEQTVSGCPWDANQALELHVTTSQIGRRNLVFVFHPDLAPQEFERASDGTWSRASFAFQSGINDTVLQPYYRFEPPGVTMDVQNYSGTSVNIQFSEGFLTSDHVGTRFRYVQASEIEIVSVTDASNAVGSIKQRLYPTVKLTITSAESVGFVAGQIIEGDVSNRQARIVSVSTTEIVAIMLDSLQRFEVIDSAIEKIVGPTGSCEPSAQATATFPASTSIWDEQLVSAARGYPSTGVVHRNRLFLGGFSQAPNLVAASTAGDPKNFNIGDAATDGFVEPLGNDPYAAIRHFVSAEQLLILTDRSAHYVPEGGEAPLTPTSVAFLSIGPEGSSLVEPVLATEGAMFIHEDTGRLMAITPTGNVRRSWEIVDLSETAPHLLGPAKQIALSNGLDGDPERYVLVLLEDGTITTASYRRGGEKFGFFQWERGQGDFQTIVAEGDTVRFTATAGSGQFLSEMSFDALIDDELDYSAADTDRNSLASHVVKNRQVIASGTVSAGEVPGKSPASGLTFGHDFEVIAETLPPYLGRVGVKKMRIVRYGAEVIDTGLVRVGGKLHDATLTNGEIVDAGVVRSRLCSGFCLGWSIEPTLQIKQDIGSGARLEVRSLTFEVGY